MQQYIFLERKFFKFLDDMQFERNILLLKMIQEHVSFYRICRCISRPFSIKNRPKKIDLDLYTES